MPETPVITCMSPNVKRMLRELLPDTDNMQELLEETPECQTGSIRLAKAPAAAGEKKKRAPSKYNIFVGECLRERPEGIPVTEHMKTCAIEWKTEKEKSS